MTSLPMLRCTCGPAFQSHGGIPAELWPFRWGREELDPLYLPEPWWKKSRCHDIVTNSLDHWKMWQPKGFQAGTKNVTLWWTNIAMGNHHFSWENPLYMAIFHCYVSSPEGNDWRVSTPVMVDGMVTMALAKPSFFLMCLAPSTTKRTKSISHQPIVY